MLAALTAHLQRLILAIFVCVATPFSIVVRIFVCLGALCFSLSISISISISHSISIA